MASDVSEDWLKYNTALFRTKMEIAGFDEATAQSVSRIAYDWDTARVDHGKRSFLPLFSDALFSVCESPIERRFLMCLILHLLKVEDSPFWFPSAPVARAVIAIGGYCVSVQETVGSARLDFCVRRFSFDNIEPLDRTSHMATLARSGLVLGIELDGHAFHERTKEQATRDKSRDRELLRDGFPVVRFTGSEVFKDGMGCWAEALDILETLARSYTPNLNE